MARGRAGFFAEKSGVGVVSGKPAPLRGALSAGRALADFTWLRVGGPADWLAQPADLADLQAFLQALPPDLPRFVLGLGSNLIVRDGGLRGVVIRLGRGFNAITIAGDRVVAGAAALDAHVARRAAEAGLDLSFLRTIPGAIGGAVRMNAGCYGTYVADVLESVQVVARDGTLCRLSREDLALGYRSSTLPEGAVIVEACFAPPPGDPAALEARMQAQIARRDASQPTRARSAGSTFRNPKGASGTGLPGDDQSRAAWALIDAAGLRGARLGGAQISQKHANFLLNTGGARAADLEDLGELVRKKVFQTQGIWLDWEVVRVGEPAPPEGGPERGADEQKA